MTPVIRVDGLSKIYKRWPSRRRFATLKSALLGGSLLKDFRPETAFAALEDVSFAVRPGATVAVVGPNGSGKSTLLKLLAGILKPTSGSVEVRGRVAALLELGAGFHPEVSGRENIVINGIMLGLGRREIERRIPEIVRFAELEDFIDAPVKTYSSGMYVRLGFSVAVAVEPDVLLVDEVLAVGDEAFSHKCIDRFRDLKRHGRTVLLVTHALDLAAALADEAILLEGGRLTAHGEPRRIVDQYRGHVEEREEAAALSGAGPPGAARPEQPAAPPAPAETPAAAPEASPAGAPEAGLPDVWQPARWGNRAVEILRVGLTRDDGSPGLLFHTGERVVVEIEAVAHEPQEDFVFGIALHARSGQLAYGTNTFIDGLKPRSIAGAGRVRLEFPSLLLLEGTYSLDAAVHRMDGFAFDYRRACLSFTVRSPIKDVGVSRLEHRWSFAGSVDIE